MKMSKTTMIAVAKIAVILIAAIAYFFADASPEKVAGAGLVVNALLDAFGFKLSQDQKGSIGGGGTNNGDGGG